MTVLQAVDEEGESIGTLVNWDCDPATVGNDNTLISADFVGYLCDTIEEQVGGVAVFVNGALGGNTLGHTGQAPTFEEARRIGTTTGRASLAALDGAEMLDTATIRLAAVDVRLPVENPVFRAAAEFGIMALAAADEVVTQVTAIDLGAAQIVAVPGAPVPVVGATIRELMPGPYRLLVGLSPIQLGYVLPQKHYDGSAYEYERRMSLGPRTAPMLTSKLRQLLGQLASEQDGGEAVPAR
jgi:hypothetical protein